jgi:hypothetical protein
MSEIIEKLFYWLKSKSKQPWAVFKTDGVVNETVKYEMHWNDAFLDNIKKAGFVGHNEQEIVESFFLGSIMIPKMNAMDDPADLPPTIDAVDPKNRVKS